ncbi:MAG: hypothetical protein MJ180_01685, partial [Candidatus Gastranaerophilales bacterium]|nr:hypothetical protein [Candidatus Gastranaerophilales bacterium]
HKTTLCRKFKTKENALKFILFFYVVSFLLIIYMSKGNHLYLLTFLTIPLIADLYSSLNNYNKDKTNLPQIKFWHYPLDNWKEVSKTEDAPFYFRFFYSRNIMTFFLLLTCIAILFS